MKLTKVGQTAFTLVEIMIVVAIIGMLAAIAIPNFVKARNTAQANACINNMRQIDGAISQWALDKGKKDTDPVVENEIKEYIKGGEMPTCPAGHATYTVGPNVNSNPTVTCPNADSNPPHRLGGTTP